MRSAVTVMLFGLAAVQGALLRGDPVVTDSNTPEDIRSEVAAGVDSGCDGVQCGHKPAMVERGHFAKNAFSTKLAGPKFKDSYHPALVPPGTFNATLHKQLQEPLKTPLLEKPNMVPPGHFAHVARTKAEIRAAMNNRDLPAQQAGTCKILDKVVTMARFVYEVESSTADGIDKSGQAISKLMDLMCPLVKTHYPDATKGMECAALSETVKKFYDPVYVGQTKTLKQRCANAPGHKVNFALLAALVGPKTLFGATFCEDKHDALKCMAKTISELKPIENKTVDQIAQENDKIEKIAEKKVSIDEGDWARAQATKVKGEPESESSDELGEPRDAGASHRCRNCKHKRAKMKELGLDVPGEKGYDVHNEENVHNVVTDKEASAINQPRGPVEVHTIPK
jgi:hypothetical protein